MGERNPPALADLLQPHLVSRFRYKVISVSLDGQAAPPENLREAVSEVAVGEIDKAQAARS
jgi:hypothetical protein